MTSGLALNSSICERTVRAMMAVARPYLSVSEYLSGSSSERASSSLSSQFIISSHGVRFWKYSSSGASLATGFSGEKGMGPNIMASIQ